MKICFHSLLKQIMFSSYKDILNELENEEIPAYIQAARIDQMVKEAVKLRQMRDGYGAYS